MKTLPAALRHPKPYRRGLMIAASLMALSGCVSSVGTEFETSEAVSPAAHSESQTAAADTPAQQATKAAEETDYTDPAVVTAHDGAASKTAAASMPVASPAGAPADIAGLTMQPTTVNAGQTSIFAAPGATATNAAATQDADAAEDEQSIGAPAFVPVPEINPALKSVYSAPETPAQPQAAADIAPANAPPAGKAAVDDTPATATATADQSTSIADTKGELETGDDTAGKPQPLTLAAFFAGKRKARDKITDNGSSMSGRSPRIVSQAATMATKPTVLSDEDVGELMPDNFLDDDEFDDGHAEVAEGLMKLASLPGLTRVAPNGLMLQTPRVEVSCLKPDLVKIIKSIETHYGSTAIVTSGYRGSKHNRKVGGRRGSLHTTCQAADIQVPGVSKWELASYLRSRPDRGGVGTYCHTESVHLDLGPARDWNWRCRRKK